MNVRRFTHRLATEADVRAIEDLMKASIAENMKEFLTGEQIAATQESMGLDTTLICDRTYFVVETVQNGQAVMVGCGGWSRRRTLYGGDHTAGRDDSYADPATDAARIRAMYTRPGRTRQGIGSLLLQLGETPRGRRGSPRSSSAPPCPASRSTGHGATSRSAARR